jgi:predicted RecA/RadA family phage recombinase
MRLDDKLKDIDTEGITVDDELIDKVADAVAEKLASSSENSSTEWNVVKLPKGQTMTFSIGAQILLRIGSVSCVSTGSPGLINLTSATELSNGGALAKNNLYIVTVEGRGIKASADATL